MVSKNFITNAAHIFLWICGMLFPALVFYYFTGSSQDAVSVLKTTVKILGPVYIPYFLNYYLFVPRFLFRDKKPLFYCLNALLFICIAIPMFFTMRTGALLPDVDPEAVKYLKASIWGIYIGYLVISITFILLSVGVKYIMRWNEEKQKLEEERRHNAEAELQWLKNQLNPHFLFNTLNNISSLVRIDADRAQDSIAQLSELLRYALYDSNCKKVKIKDEVDFMRNYVELMSLRCSRKTRVEVRFDDFGESVMISPLMFISLVENAFKHGTSAHIDSFVRIDMGISGKDLVFSCENSVIERNTGNYGGSGVGLENMCRRLELLYPDSHSYEHFTENGVYVAIVRIKDINADA